MGKRRATCAQGCGREPREGQTVCGPCRLAIRQGYYLSPAPSPGERRNDRKRAERMEQYRRRAEQRRDLFDGGDDG